MTGWWLDDGDVRVAAGDCCELMPHMEAEYLQIIAGRLAQLSLLGGA